MAGTGAPATDDRGSPFEPVEIRAGVAAEDVLERWTAGSSGARGEARGGARRGEAPGTTIPAARSGTGACRSSARPWTAARRRGGWSREGPVRPGWPSMGRTEPGRTPGRGPATWCSCTSARRRRLPPGATRAKGRTRSWPPSPRAWPGWGATWATTSWSTATGAGTGRRCAGGSRSAGRTAGSARAPSRRGPSARPCRWSSGGPPRGTPGGAGRPPSAGRGRGAAVRLRPGESVPGAGPAGPARRGGQRTRDRRRGADPLLRAGAPPAPRAPGELPRHAAPRAGAHPAGGGAVQRAGRRRPAAGDARPLVRAGGDRPGGHRPQLRRAGVRPGRLARRGGDQPPPARGRARRGRCGRWCSTSAPARTPP